MTGVRRLRAEALAVRGLRAPDQDGVTRKDLAKAAREAAQALDLRPSARLVLGELVGCYGEQALDRGLMVWPSNAYLERKTGLAERSIRRAVICLVEAKLIEPVDSANRKRFAIRSRGGEIVDAFGFNLAPIYAQRAEFAGILLQRQIQNDARSRLFDEVTIARKAIEEALRALATHYPAVPRQVAELRFVGLLARIPPRRSQAPLEALLGELRDLRAEIENAFQAASNEHLESGRARQADHHIETDNGLPIGDYHRLGEEEVVRSDERIPLGLVVEACPALIDHLAGPITSENDLITAGKYLRGSIGAHLDAWHEGVMALGALRAAILVLYVLQIHTDDVASGANRIKNPGGLLRSLFRRLAQNDFDLKAELQALRRRHMT